jgi:hypothetical protein
MPANVLLVRSTAALDHPVTAATPISVVIDGGLMEVFDFAANCTWLSRWFMHVVEVSGDASTRPGSEYRVTVVVDGVRLTGSLEVTAFQHDRHILACVLGSGRGG